MINSNNRPNDKYTMHGKVSKKYNYCSNLLDRGFMSVSIDLFVFLTFISYYWVHDHSIRGI